MDPLISIVMSTYHRSSVIRYAIRSVLRQTYSRWELIVVGDHCTDETEHVVASFVDPRISFFNLEKNHGEQSVPNNEGVRRSKGEYIAFLNHDDLWLDDHLEQCLQHMHTTSADMVYALGINFEPDGQLTLINGSPSRRYSPYIFSPASTWLLKKAVHDKLKGWKSASTLHNTPSQDFIFRAWKQGKSILLVPQLTVAIIPSGKRIGSYSSPDTALFESLFRHTEDPERFRADILQRVAITEQSNYLRTFTPGYLLLRLLKNLFLRCAVIFGVHPNAMMNFFRYGKKGGVFTVLRKNRGLPVKEIHR